MEPTKIESATPEQWAEVGKIRQKWIDLQTYQSTGEEIRGAVRNMWRQIEDASDDPVILIADSPLSAVIMAEAAMRLYADDSVGIQLDEKALPDQLQQRLQNLILPSDTQTRVRDMWKRVEEEASNGSPASAEKLVAAAMKLYADDEVAGAADGNYDRVAGEPLSAQLCQCLLDRMRPSLTKQVLLQSNMTRDDVQTVLDSIVVQDMRLEQHPRYISLWSSCSAGWYEGAKCFGVQFDETMLDLFVNWSWHVMFSVPYAGLVVVGRRPVEIHWEGTDLHNPEGYAVRFADGYPVWSIRGVAADEQIVMRPKTQTLEQINQEPNEEVKRLRIERYGWFEYLEGIGAVALDSRFNEIEQVHEELVWSQKYGITGLKVECPTKREKYVLEVPNGTSTCEQAQQYLSSGLSNRIISAS